MNGRLLRCAAVAATLIANLSAAPVTIAADNALPIGFHDAFGGQASDVGCVAYGWAVDPDALSTPVTIRVLADGQEVATVVANDFRQDLVDAGVDPEGTAGFTIDLHGLVPAGVPVSVAAAAQDLQTDEWIALEGTPFELLCTGLGGFQDTGEGLVDRFGCYSEGWAWDRHHPDDPITVRVSVDGEPVADITADAFRQDLLEAGLGDGEHGWAIDLWDLMSRGEAHLLSMDAIDADADGVSLHLNETDRFMTCVDASDALVVRDLRTGTEHVLTDLPSTGEYNAAWSPDGKLLAHEVFGDAGLQLWLTDVRTGESRRVPGDHLANDPSWSPDGEFLLVDRLAELDQSVFRVDVESGAAEPVVGSAVDADWHPEAPRIVFVRAEFNELVVFDLRTGDEWHLADITMGVPQDPADQVVAGINPAWSPGGRWVLYTDGGDLFKIRVSGTGHPSGDPVRLTDTDAIESGADWLPNATSVVFKSNASGDYGIRTMAATGGAQAVVVDSPGIGDYDPAVSKNGRYLAYTRSAFVP